MKNLHRTLFILILSTTVAIMAFTVSNDDPLQVKSSGGAPSGYSGDPAGLNKNCTNCHTGTAQTQEGLITSDVPETGYVPGTTYTITTTASGEGISKFGFQVSPQNSSGTILGTLVNTNDNTKLVGSNNYVTHTSAGNAGANEKVWTFDWTAPAAGSGDVTFYGAINLADNNGGTSGDEILLSTLTVTEEESTSIQVQDTKNKFSVYPNPASDYVILETAEDLNPSGYVIFDQAGRELISEEITGRSTTISIDQLKTGIYYLRVSGDFDQVVKFIKE